MPAPPETGPDASSSSSHPRLHSCNGTEPGPGSACRCCASSPSRLSPSRTGEPWVMFNSPAWSPQPSHTAAGSQALTSKDRGTSAFAWLAMPMGQAVVLSHRPDVTDLPGAAAAAAGTHGRWLQALWKAQWPLRGGRGAGGTVLLCPHRRA